MLVMLGFIELIESGNEDEYKKVAIRVIDTSNFKCESILLSELKRYLKDIDNLSMKRGLLECSQIGLVPDIIISRSENGEVDIDTDLEYNQNIKKINNESTLIKIGETQDGLLLSSIYGKLYGETWGGIKSSDNIINLECGVDLSNNKLACRYTLSANRLERQRIKLRALGKELMPSYHTTCLKFLDEESLVNFRFASIGKGAAHINWNIREIKHLDTLVEIEESAFERSSISKIELDTGVIKIGKFAFSNSLLSEIEIPESVEFIGNHAFADCNSLKSVSIRGKNRTIKYNNRDIRGIVLPTGAFRECTELIKVESEVPVVELGVYALDGTRNLKEFDTSHLIRVYGQSMRECGLAKLSLDSIEYIAEYAFDEALAYNIHIGMKCKNIGYMAFQGCERLTEFVCESPEAEFSGRIFKGCYSLTKLSIHCKSVTSSTFDDCGLKMITIVSDNLEIEQVHRDYCSGRAIKEHSSIEEIRIVTNDINYYLDKLSDIYSIGKAGAQIVFVNQGVTYKE